MAWRLVHLADQAEALKTKRLKHFYLQEHLMSEKVNTTFSR